MSRFTKLLKTPGAFFRDLLVKRYPLDFGGNLGVVAEAGRHLQDPLEVKFPIDLVYTWVDHSDPEWQQAKADCGGGARQAALDEDTSNLARFEDHEELRFSLRSVELYAPWVRRIFVVTAGHVPGWLNVAHPLIEVVDHKQIIDARYLPTFNSHVIEAHLHRIGGLSEHYLYLNDDVMFARPCRPSDFFLGSGATIVSLSRKYLAEGVAVAGDTPMDCASKNVRALIEQEYGVFVRRQILHSIHPQRRSVAERCTDLVLCRNNFFQNRFRSRTDLNVATLMHHYVSYLEGKSVFARSTCMYFNVRSPNARASYQALMGLKGGPNAPDTMCLNQVVGALDPNEEAAYNSAQREFLEGYFPAPSAYER